jgi:hypothetical protein
MSTITLPDPSTGAFESESGPSLNRPTLRTVTERPLRYLARISKDHPGLWREMDRLRANPLRAGGWPSWCFLPAGGADQAALALGRNLDAFQTAVLCALYSWRPTQGVYLFDPDLLDAVWDTPVSGDIPAEILKQLPEWCCYVAFPAPRFLDDVELGGYFMHLDYDFQYRRPNLHLILDATQTDGSTYLSPSLMCLVGDMGECFRASFRRLEESVKEDGGFSLGFDTPEEGYAYVENVRRRDQDHPNELAPLVSLALYLASATREMRSGALTRPVRPAVQQTRRDGPRIFPPASPRVWEVGFRTGAALRAGEAASAPASSGEGRTHGSPRPHLRMAHWHHFWTGPLTGERQLILKWLHPILVAAGDER